MSLPVYLAFTAAEFGPALPKSCAYMACHFSPYGTGLSNLPRELPEDSLLILNDRIPAQGHDPERIAGEMLELAERFVCNGVLLDFQRESRESRMIAERIVSSLPCPVGVTERYAEDLDCPVFLMPPVYQPLSQTLKSWSGREIWLELGCATQVLTVTGNGCNISPMLSYDGGKARFYAQELACRYTTVLKEDAAVFTMSRDRECLNELLQQAEELGITRAVGLYQELGDFLQEKDTLYEPSGSPPPTKHA